jgi:hypothetical protein
MIRDLSPEDLMLLRDIHNKENLYPFHDVNSPLYCIRKAIIVDDKLVGAALVRLTSEVSLVLDKDVNRITRAREMHRIFDSLMDALRQFGLNDTHIFAEGKDAPQMAKFLKKHFQFVDATGIPLYRQYKEGE